MSFCGKIKSGILKKGCVLRSWAENGFDSASKQGQKDF